MCRQSLQNYTLHFLTNGYFIDSTTPPYPTPTYPIPTEPPAIFIDIDAPPIQVVNVGTNLRIRCSATSTAPNVS